MLYNGCPDIVEHVHTALQEEIKRIQLASMQKANKHSFANLLRNAIDPTTGRVLTGYIKVFNDPLAVIMLWSLEAGHTMQSPNLSLMLMTWGNE